MASLFARPGYRRLVVAGLVSGLGDWTVTVALLAFVHHLTGSSAATGALLAARLVPGLVAAPAMSSLTRRFGRRRLMMGADLARAGLVASLALFPSLGWLYASVFMIELGTMIYLPARDASVPDLVPADRLGTANALMLAASFGTIPVGAAVFSGLAAFNEEPWRLALGLDAVALLAGFLLIRGLHVLDEPHLLPETSEDGGRVGPRWGSAAERREAIRPLVRRALPAALAVALGLGTLFSVGVSFVKDTLGAGDAEFGLLVALFGVGAGVGIVVLRSISAGPLVIVRWAVLGQAATVLGMSQARATWVAMVGAIGFGGAAAASITAGMSFLQHAVSGPRRVMAFSIFHVSIRLGLAAAALLAGVAVDQLDRLGIGIEPNRIVLAGSAVVVGLAALLVGGRIGELAKGAG